MTDDIAVGLNEILTALRNDRPLHVVDWERHLTEAISRLTTLPEDQVKQAAEIIANSPLIDAPKLPAECWHGLARSILEVRAPPLPDEKREQLAKMIEPVDDEAFPPSWSGDKILGNRLARAWAAAVVRGGPVEGIDVQIRRPLPDEIAALIKRLRYPIQDWSQVVKDMRIAADALSRLAAPPLPEKIVGLIKRADDAAINTDRAEDRKLFAELGDALCALALENERQMHRALLAEDHLKASVKAGESYAEEHDLFRNRIRELETERDALKKDFEGERAACGEAYRQREELRAERDAIQAKTIEECAQAIERSHDEYSSECKVHYAKRIRALAQMEESKTESGE
jgi:hypothetical protein